MGRRARGSYRVGATCAFSWELQALYDLLFHAAIVTRTTTAYRYPLWPVRDERYLSSRRFPCVFYILFLIGAGGGGLCALVRVVSTRLRVGPRLVYCCNPSIVLYVLSSLHPVSATSNV